MGTMKMRSTMKSEQIIHDMQNNIVTLVTLLELDEKERGSSEDLRLVKKLALEILKKISELKKNVS